jgi:uncharacterized protein (TIGR03435 family)
MRSLALVIPFVATMVAASAQTPATSQSSEGPPPSFEVASVKANKTVNGPMMMRTLPSSFNVTNLPLRLLITQAYRLRPYQLQGGPSWLDSERFDIVAKPPDGANPDQLMPMLQSLLAERFKLVTHKDTKEAPIYALVIARSDGKLGPKLSPTTDDCEAVLAERRAAARARGPGPAPFTPTSPTERPICTMSMNASPSNGIVIMHYRGGGQTIANLARQIESVAGRPVVDRTGLTGLYDYDLEYSLQRPLTTAPAAAASGQATVAAPIDDGPTVFDAVQQLGLKLESTRGPVEYLVIDRVEKPIDD